MLFKISLAAAIVFSVSIASAKSHKTEDVQGVGDGLVQSLNKVADVYRNYDCENEFSEQTAKDLVAACKEANENPEIMSTKGNVNCYFDLENYQVSVNSNTLTPEYRIAPNGDISKIVKGELDVAAASCRKLEGDKVKASSERHPASEDLCLSYFPDKYFSKYQEKPECNELKAKPAQQNAEPQNPDEQKKAEDHHAGMINKVMNVVADDDDDIDIGDSDGWEIA